MRRCKKILVFKFSVVFIVGIIFNTLIICHYFIRREPFLYENTPIINISDKCKKNLFPRRARITMQVGLGGKNFSILQMFLIGVNYLTLFVTLKARGPKGQVESVGCFTKVWKGSLKVIFFLEDLE